MKLRRQPLLAVTALILGILALAAGPAQASTARHNATDDAFVAMMLPHHEGGIKLGALAATKGVNGDVRRLGRSIRTKQTAEAKLLRRLVREFRTRKADPPPEMKRRDAIDMARLRAATGKAFDMRWLDVISAHHSAAIQMAQIEIRSGLNGVARGLAMSIVATQRRELGEFNTLTAKIDG